MGRKANISPEIKVKYVEMIIAGETSLAESARELGVDKSSIRQWISLYKSEGPLGLKPRHENRNYSQDIRESAVEAYLNGEGSLMDICGKYGISSHHILRKWVERYNAHGILKPRGGGPKMSTNRSRKTTIEERIEIVNYCLDHGYNYGETAQKYNVTYQNVYQWVSRYKKLGEPGLEDRRGKRTGSMPARSPEEELKARIAQLEAHNKLLQMENDLLKKVEELSRDRRFR